MATSKKRFKARDILGKEHFIFANNLEEARDKAQEEHGPFTSVKEYGNLPSEEENDGKSEIHWNKSYSYQEAFI